jgi:hypothetical protein
MTSRIIEFRLFPVRSPDFLSILARSGMGKTKRIGVYIPGRVMYSIKLSLLPHPPLSYRQPLTFTLAHR